MRRPEIRDASCLPTKRNMPIGLLRVTLLVIAVINDTGTTMEPNFEAAAVGDLRRARCSSRLFDPQQVLSENL